MTYQIKSIFTDQDVVKRAYQSPGFDLGLRHHVIHQRNPLPMHRSLNHHGAVAENRPLLYINVLQPQLTRIGQPIAA
ncbi:hypothetical protein D3C71_2115180 [compost metagenome]